LRPTLAWLLVLLAALIAYKVARSLTYTPPHPLSNLENGPTPSPKTRMIWNAPPEQPMPNTGHGRFNFDRASADSRIRIRPRRELGNVVVKVENFDDRQTACWFFIRRGDMGETVIPAGRYRLKLASGEKWYGEQHLFGPEASYRAVDDPVQIAARVDLTIDLEPTKKGTLHEADLRAEDF
jgi:hypothetical protein